MAQKTIKLNEGKLNSLIKESIKKVLREFEEWSPQKGNDASFDDAIAVYDAKDAKEAKAVFQEKGEGARTGAGGYKVVNVNGNWLLLIVNVGGKHYAQRPSGSIEEIPSNTFETWAKSNRTVHLSNENIYGEDSEFAKKLDSMATNISAVNRYLNEFKQSSEGQGFDYSDMEAKFYAFTQAFHKFVSTSDNQYIRDRFAKEGPHAGFGSNGVLDRIGKMGM